MAKLSEMIEVANPQQPHVAVILLLDVSGSMSGGKISQLNEALHAFKESVVTDDLARKRVDLSVVTFSNDVDVIHGFSAITAFDPPLLSTGGGTSMGAGIMKALELLERRKSEYKTNGVSFFCPWLFLITDGEPTDMSPGDAMWTIVTQAVREAETKRKCLFFCVGVEPADMNVLKQLAPPERIPLQLKAGMFKEMFLWVSRSLKSVSAAKPGESAPIENPTAGPQGWAGFPT